MIADFVIEPLGKRHSRGNFDCGEGSLNQFLRHYARQNSASGFGKTFVAVQTGGNEVLGYYTIASGSLSFEVIPAKLPRYPVPTAHIGRLAVDLRTQGQRLGELLLIDALERVELVAQDLGIYAVELYALTESAKRFYLKYGFVSLLDDDKHLYLPLATIKDAILLKG